MSRITHVAIYICDRCKEEICPTGPDDITTGYGVTGDGAKHCFPCCGDVDREHMLSHGKITLYLVEHDDPRPNPEGYKRVKWHWVTNWPSSLEFRVTGGPYKSHHNMARYRYDFWFHGPDGHIWHGYQCGDNTQIAHCKRTKQLWRKSQHDNRQ